MSTPILTQEFFQEGLEILVKRDKDLAKIVETYGPPPFWTRDPGFGALVYTILEQQVSLASAKAAFSKLLLAAYPLTPEQFTALSDEELKAIGFSRQKAGYCRGLAREIIDGELDLEGLADLEDDGVRKRLLALKGIGPWTADVYLLMALRRQDVWPIGDMALVRALEEVKGVPKGASAEKLQKVGEPWRPWRAVASRILWHHYLSRLAERTEKPAEPDRVADSDKTEESG